MASNALAERSVSTGHKIDWAHARVLEKEKNRTSRLYLDSLIIQTTANMLKRGDGNLPPVYKRCLGSDMRRT